MDSSFIKLICNIAGSDSVFINEPMKKHTSFKIGGNADVLVLPTSETVIAEIIKLSIKSQIPYFVIGNGSNLIIRDGGIRGLVIKMSGIISDTIVKGNIIEAHSGILLSKLSKIALENELTGLEFAEGIPGTLGGAVIMNAGAYTGEIKDIVIKTKYIDKNGDLKVISGEEHKFGKRTSIFHEEYGIVIKSWLKLEKGIKENIEMTMNEFSQKRRDKQPLEMPSAGSVFKRPDGHFAGKLIEDCGLKGFSIGGARISDKHCGFIVNTGDANASDVINLIKHIQNCVKNKYNVVLETEVKIVGED
jgi:UDP-N-acetylmuramate dehydrogenase